MAMAPEQTGIGIRRHFTTAGVHPYDEVDVGAARRPHHQLPRRLGRLRAARRRVPGRLVAQRHQHRRPEVLPRHARHRPSGSARSSRSSTAWSTPSPRGASRDGYFVDDDEAETFRAELKHLIVTQKAAFNSPVWFNIGVKGVPQQASACFILVRRRHDGLDPQLVRRGGHDLQGRLGRRHQPLPHPLVASSCLKGGGTASGPVSFMRGADASAGTIKSGGKTRRAAKMVILDVDHPDIEEFIWCKASEEQQGPRPRRRRLRHGPRRRRQPLDPVPERQQLGPGHRRVHAGRRRRRRLAPAGRHDRRGHQDRPGPRPHAPDLPGHLGVRRSRHAVRHHHQPLAHRGQHRAHQRLEPVLRVHAPRQLGVQPGQPQPARRSSTRTTPSTSTASRHAVEVVFTAQEILVGNADYPTEPIAETSRQFRQLGLGYANLGALLMALGLPYDSDEGRAWAAAITAAHDRPRLRHLGPHRRPHGPLRRLRRERASTCCGCSTMHREPRPPRSTRSSCPPSCSSAAQQSWDEACELAAEVGVRNSPGLGAGPHRHHRPDDGLRHHRHRARPRPGAR